MGLEVPLIELKLEKIYYLYHREESKPSFGVCTPVKIIHKNKEEIWVERLGNDYFYGSKMERYKTICFLIVNYKKSWYLS